MTETKMTDAYCISHVELGNNNQQSSYLHKLMLANKV